MKLVIIDGNSFLFRAYFAMRPMVTKDGVYTQGVYAFLTMLNKVISDQSPDYLAVCFDMKGKTFRHDRYPEYKAGRRKTPVELLSQIPIMHRVLEAMNIRIFEQERIEADDLIGTITARAEAEGITSVVITGDKDALQLVDEHTTVLINKRGMSEFTLYDPEAMQERYGLTPTQFIDLKGLMGDTSDNIPGIPGVGEKKGIALLRQYGSVEEVVANAAEIKGKMGENVRAHAALATLSKELATIKRDVPLSFAFDDLALKEPNHERLASLYRELEFSSFLRKLEQGLPETEGEADLGSGKTDEIQTVEEADFYERVSEGAQVVLSMMTEKDYVREPVVHGFALYAPEEQLYTLCTLTAFDAEAALRRLASRDYRVIGHDLKPALYAMMSLGITGIRLQHDTAIAEYLLDPNRSRYLVGKMAVKYTSLSCEDEGMDKVHLLAVAEIAAAQTKFLAQEGLTEVFSECEMPLIETLTAMEVVGMKVDHRLLEETGRELDGRIEALEKRIHEAAGIAFNINSPKQLGTVLFEELAIPYPKRSKGKNGYSTAADVLEKLRFDHPFVEDVLEYRKCTKLRSTYIEGLRALIAHDGRIHPHFNQTVAATGRISCTEPNLQNIPIRDEYGRNIRKAFVPENEEYVFVGADYSQIELRILAAFSGDRGLIEAFNKGEDIHRITAARVFDLAPEDVTLLDRSRAKAVNFGVIYGMSGFGLSEELLISRAEAQRYIDEYFEKHEAVKAYLDRQVEIGAKEHAVRTLLGRVRQIPEFTSGKYMERQAAARLAMNTPIQGSAADIIKIAMNKVYKELCERGMRSRLVLQIHDELIIEAVRDEVEEVKELLRRNMETAADLEVALLAELHTGQTWYELK